MVFILQIFIIWTLHIFKDRLPVINATGERENIVKGLGFAYYNILNIHPFDFILKHDQVIDRDGNVP